MVKMTRYTRKYGFTLIELIMVIVILGILSAFALPRFADFSDQAQDASIDGARGGVRSASAIAHAACLADANCGTTVTIDGEAIDMILEYPDRDEIEALASLDGYYTEDVTISGGTTPVNVDSIIIAIENTDGSPCFAYRQAFTDTDEFPAAVSAQGTLTSGTPSTCSGTF